MRRGDLVLIREPGTPASKARPCLVVQRSDALAARRKVTACPLTTTLRGVPGQRPIVMPSAENRLREPSEVEVDWIYTHKFEHVGGMIGTVDPATMEAVDVALRRWLDL